MALEYSVDGLSHKTYKKILKSKHPRHYASNLVSSHVRLFIFADTYAIEGLKHLCLHMLHRDLSELDLKGSNIEEVVDMFHCTYEYTVRQTTQIYGVGEDLRKLVMAFAGWRASALLSYQVFDDLIAEGEDLATDFMRVLMKQLHTS